MKTKRFLSALLCAVLVLTLLPVAARADNDLSSYTFDVSLGSITVNDATSGNLTVTYSGGTTDPFPNTQEITITGTTASNNISVSSGVTTNITLSDVSIDKSAGGCAFDMAGAVVDLTLSGTNTLTSGNDNAGLHVPAGAELTIRDSAGGGGALTATGVGAGIGGRFMEDGGTVTIIGGSVTATGSGGGPGIGGGNSGDGGTVTIIGGSVTATGNGGGAGIGGGNSGDGGTVTISGGTVTANGGSAVLVGAGIGGGYLGNGGTVYISGGSVKATGGIGAAVGPGNGGSGGTLKNKPAVEGGVDVYLTTVTLSGAADKTPVSELTTDAGYMYGMTDGKTDGALIYVYLPEGTDITGVKTGSPTPTAAYLGDITTANVHTTTGTLYPAAFDVSGSAAGFDYDYDGTHTLTFTQSGDYTVSMLIPGSTTTTDQIVVNGGTTDNPVNLTLDGVSIDLSSGGRAFDMSGADVNLTLSGTSTLTSGTYNAGLHCPLGAELTIGGAGSLTANGGTGGAGIGGGLGSSCGTVIITGGIVAAIGSYDSAGIGGGNGFSVGGTVTITGGTVTASGAYGIGGGISGAPGTTVITGGSVKASSIMGTPANGTENVYLTTVTLSGAANETPVTSLTAAPGYGINDVQTIGSALYLYLPANTQTTEARTAGAVYTGDIDTGTAGGSGTLYDVSLSALALSEGTLSPTFAGDTYGYTVSVGNSTNTLTVTPTAHDTNATVTVNGVSVTSGSASDAFSLNVGANTVTVIVTAQDDITTQTYTVTVTRAAGTGGGVSSSAPAYKAEVSGGGTLTITVDAASGSASVTVGDTLGASLQSGGNETITMPAIPGVTSYTLGIPVAYLSTSGGGTLTFNTDTGSVTLPADMLSGVEGAAGKKAEITVAAGDKSGLTDEGKAAIGDRPLIELSLTLDGVQTDWSNPDAPVTVSIPYTPAEGEDLNAIIIWYIDGDGNLSCVPNGRYDPETGTVTFEVTHFSLYAVGYNAAAFSDVAEGAWYYDAVRFIAAREITGGTGDGSTFSPDAMLTRGEFIVMLLRTYGIAPDENPDDNFSDAGDTYYTGYLAAAKRLGISAGIGDNLFAPRKEITRQEMFTLLYNALNVIGQFPQGDSGKALSDFIDSEQIAAWAQEAMTQLVETGTVGGNNGAISPLGTTTRAEMAQVLYNLLGK